LLEQIAPHWEVVACRLAMEQLLHKHQVSSQMHVVETIRIKQTTYVSN